MARDGLTEEAAAKLVDDTNTRREQWVRKYFRRAWRDYSNYHIAVNTEWLGIDGAANLVVQTAKAVRISP